MLQGDCDSTPPLMAIPLWPFKFLIYGSMRFNVFNPSMVLRCVIWTGFGGIELLDEVVGVQ